MKKIFTLPMAAIGLIMSLNSSAQTCSVNQTAQTYTSNLAVSAGNSFSSTGQSTLGTFPNSTSTTLISPVYLNPSASSSVSFGVHLAAAGNPGAQINSFTIKVVYQGISGTCSNSTAIPLTMGGGDYNFSISGLASPIPAGKYYQIYLTFDVAGPSNKDVVASIFRSNSSPGPAGIILPVKFAGFDGTFTGKTTNLTWRVGTEDNLNGYYVERSPDGSNFSQIGFVPAAGKSTYYFVDANPVLTSYYRIKAVDIDGKYGYSSIVLVKTDGSSAMMKAFPSPVTSSVTIQHSTVTVGTSITISSADGRLYKSIIPVTGSQQTTVDLSSAKPGLYLARYANASGEVSTIKIIKQ